MNKKGVTLMAVLTIIVVITILTVTVSFSGINIMKDVKMKKFAMSIAEVEEAFIRLNEPLEKTITRNIIKVKSTTQNKADFPGEQAVSGYYNFYLVEPSELSIETDIGNLTKGPNDAFAYSTTTGRMYYVRGVEISGKRYYSLTDELRKKINLNEVKKENELKDGILAKKSITKFTNNNISLDVYIPEKYSNPDVTSQDASTLDKTVSLVTYKGEKYNKIEVKNIAKNINLNISYNGKTQVYAINNIDKTAPTITYEDTFVRKTDKGDEAYITGIKAKDNSSKIVKLKYETEYIDKSQAKKYFNSNGIPVREEKIKVAYPENKYTIYCEDEAGNYDCIYVQLTAFEGNKPLLNNDMIPIKYNGTNWVICSKDDKDWYDYNEKRWANAMLCDGKYKDKNAIGQVINDADLGSMFVWIPRFAYSIKEYKVTKTNGEGTNQNLFDIEFLEGTTNIGINRVAYPSDYNENYVKKGEATPKIVHPAFTFNNTEIPGFWTAKFEASMAEFNNNTLDNNNDPLKKVRIVPNAMTWRYIHIGTMFDICRNMKVKSSYYGSLANVDSHLMKNIEWGAVSYLTASNYGTMPTTNTLHATPSSGVKEQWAGGRDYKKNISQSTTGNITGVYDMNGGAWEYVAGYFDNENAYLRNYGGEDKFPGKKLDPSLEAYWDKYLVCQDEIIAGTVDNDKVWPLGQEANQRRKTMTNERYKLMKSKKGDAMYEIIEETGYSYYGRKTDGNYDWIKSLTTSVAERGTTVYNGDFAAFGNTYIPFLIRGGGWWDDTCTGIFASMGDSGGEDGYGIGFRPVLVCI